MDILDLSRLGEIFAQERPEKVIHLAARAGVRASILNPLLYKETNIGGTLNLLELAKENDVANFVFASSSSVYGENSKIPFSEDDRTDCPVSPYAATKKACELFCYTYSRLAGLNITCLRFFTAYGPRGRPDMAPYLFTKNITEGKQIQRFGDGRSKRDYTYISDIVSGVVSALDKKFKFEIINLGNSKTAELNEFIRLIERMAGKKADIKQMPMQKGDVPATYADISKAKRLLGWEPKVSLEEGMKKFIDWYNNKIHLGLSRTEGVTPKEAVMNKLQPTSLVGLFFRRIK